MAGALQGGGGSRPGAPRRGPCAASQDAVGGQGGRVGKIQAGKGQTDVRENVPSPQKGFFL